MGIVRFALKFPYTFFVLAGDHRNVDFRENIDWHDNGRCHPEKQNQGVIWQFTGLSTPEMEQRVTTYGQYAISTSVTGIKNMEAQTTVDPDRDDFHSVVDPDFARGALLSRPQCAAETQGKEGRRCRKAA
jgi:hypothetical protein